MLLKILVFLCEGINFSFKRAYLLEQLADNCFISIASSHVLRWGLVKPTSSHASLESFLEVILILTIVIEFAAWIFVVALLNDLGTNIALVAIHLGGCIRLGEGITT